MSPGRRGDKKISRRAALALAGLGGIGALGASGAFSSIEGSRRFDVETTDDDRALLELVSTEDATSSNQPLNAATIEYSVTSGDVIGLVDLANTVGEDVEFTTLKTESPHDDLSVTLQSPPTSLSDGAVTTLDAKVSCGSVGACEGAATGPVDLVVVAEGASTRIELTRTIDITCQGPCVTCQSVGELVRYEWDGGSWTVDDEEEGGNDPNIQPTDTTLDEDGEPKQATFTIDYCSVDATVKAGTYEETYENASCDLVVTDINGKAISHVRFYCGSDSDTGTDTPAGGNGGGSTGSGFDCPASPCGSLEFDRAALPHNIKYKWGCSKIKRRLNKQSGIELDDEILDCGEIVSVEQTPGSPGAIQSGWAYVGMMATNSDVSLDSNTVLIGGLDAANVDLQGGAAIAGDVTANGNFDLDSSSVVGDVTGTNGDITLTDNAGTGTTVCGDLIAKKGTNVDIDGGSVVSGDVDLQGGTFSLDNSTVRGNVTDAANPNVSGSTVCGKVSATSGTTVDIDDGSAVGGDVIAIDGGDVQITNSEVHGDASTDGGGNLKVESGSTVHGDASTGGGGNLKVTGGSTVKGDVSAGDGGGSITITGGSTVEGNATGVTADNLTIGSNSTIEGDYPGKSGTK